jgi:hypothetical protein
MRYKKSVTPISWEFLGLVLLVLFIVGIFRSPLPGVVKSFFFDKPEEEEQFDRLVRTIDNLKQGSPDYFPNTIDTNQYSSIDLFGECKKEGERNCRQKAEICLVPIGKGESPFCKPVANADFEHQQVRIASNYKITKGKDDIVSFEII